LGCFPGPANVVQHLVPIVKDYVARCELTK
jgi:hypothetical protein